jgi:hypothetical protein
MGGFPYGDAEGKRPAEPEATEATSRHWRSNCYCWEVALDYPLSLSALTSLRGTAGLVATDRLLPL